MARSDITAINAKTISINGIPIAGSPKPLGSMTTFDQLDADAVLALNGTVLQGTLPPGAQFTNYDNINVLSGVSQADMVRYGVASTPASGAATGPTEAYYGMPRAKAATVVGLGDSRVPTFLDKATMRQKGGSDPLNNLCALAMQRYRVVGDFGKSGQYASQFLSQLPDVLALGPGVVWMPSVLNGLGQAPLGSDDANGTITAVVMQAAARLMIANGQVPMFGSEVGQIGLAAQRMAEVNAYNAAQQQWAARQRGTIFIDLRPGFCDASNVVRSEFVYDGTHWNQYGALEVAKVLKPYFDLIMPGGLSFLLDASGNPEIGGYTNLAPNPLFAVATGGTTTTGATGTFSGSTRYQKTANATMAVTSTPGSTRVVATFAAQNDDVRFSQEIPNTAWAPGDPFRGMALINVNTPPTGLAGIQLELVAFGDAPVTYSDMVATATWAGPTGSYQQLLLTQEYTMPNPTNRGVLQSLVRAKAFAAGGVDFTTTQIGPLRRQ